MIFNAAIPAGGGSSQWTVLNFSDVFAGSERANVDGTYLTNGQLVYVSCNGVDVSDLEFGASAYLPSGGACGSGITANDGLPVTVMVDELTTSYPSFLLPDGSSPEFDLCFTIIYPI